MRDIKSSIEVGSDVAAAAELVRQDLRWNVKPGTPEREDTINHHLELIRLAMVPIRAWIGRAVWGQVKAADEAALREVSDQLQYQRKQLKKMLR